jgi:hypothetical protein
MLDECLGDFASTEESGLIRTFPSPLRPLANVLCFLGNGCLWVLQIPMTGAADELGEGHAVLLQLCLHAIHKLLGQPHLNRHKLATVFNVI